MFLFRSKRQWGLTLAGAWLLLTNLLPLLSISTTGSTTGSILQILGIAAGILLLMGR